jgi:cob(I)alamin adenosyltransferase
MSNKAKRYLEQLKNEIYKLEDSLSQQPTEQQIITNAQIQALYKQRSMFTCIFEIEE